MTDRFGDPGGVRRALRAGWDSPAAGSTGWVEGAGVGASAGAPRQKGPLGYWGVRAPTRGQRGALAVVAAYRAAHTRRASHIPLGWARAGIEGD